MKSEGIRTLVRKLRLCQSARGRKRTNLGATKPLLDAHHRACFEAMVAAGLIENSERARVTWERDVEERFFAYKGAYENVHRREDFSLRCLTGLGSIGWLFFRYLFPGKTPDSRLVILMNEFGSIRFQSLAEMVKSLKAAHEPRRWWKCWK